MMRIALLVPLLFAVGCGDSGPAGNDGGNLPGDGAAGSDAGAGSDSGGGGTAKLYPLAAGYQWTYDVAQVGGGSVCAAGTYSQQVVSGNAVGGRPAFQMTSFCTAIAGTNDYSAPGGDEVDFYYMNTWGMLIDPTLTEGHMWTYFNSSYSWHRETSVTVPAGTFSDCWTAEQQVSYTAYLTYCRGVGLVRSYSMDLSGNGWDAQLTSKSF